MSSIRYYRRGTRTATAETRRTACRLTRFGWRRCLPEQHQAAWAARDAGRLAVLRPVPAEPDTRARIVGALKGVVYPKTETGL